MIFANGAIKAAMWRMQETGFYTAGRRVSACPIYRHDPRKVEMATGFEKDHAQIKG